MKKAADAGRNFSALMKKIGKPASPSKKEDPIDVLVLSLLMWESTAAKAKTAYERIQQRIVDFNDLRVSMPQEITGFIGSRYPRAEERSQRLRAVLRNIYHREHAVSLERLGTMGKREIKKYLHSLDGIVPFAADRVMLLCFGTHCIPVDENLQSALLKTGACEESLDLSELSSWLSRQVKASEAAATYFSLQAWVDRGASPPGSRPTASRAAKTTSTKKKKPTAVAGRKKSSPSQ